jgi:hypothetical protein
MCKQAVELQCVLHYLLLVSCRRLLFTSTSRIRLNAACYAYNIS